MRRSRKIGWESAAAIVVANMVGMGAFTTLGLQLQGIRNTYLIIGIWAIGGVISLFGAYSYAELGTRFPHSGGEYYFLSRIFHPFLGYLSGWVSLTVGFSTSIALTAMAIGTYMLPSVPTWGSILAMSIVLIISMVHSFNIKQSSAFQNLFTLFKIFLILIIIITGLSYTPVENALNFSDSWKEEISTTAFGLSLAYIMYAFSGWNAAAYIVDEIRDAKKNLPLALIGGTVLVSLLFILLQYAFLNQASFQELAGKIDVGRISAIKMFGESGGQIISGLITFMLIASISAMIWVGPRVTRAMAEKFHIWQYFAKDNKNGIPVRAIWLQTAISCVMIVTSSFEQILAYSSFVLQLFTTLTVAGLIWARYKKMGRNNAYRSPFFPWIQIIFIIFSIYMMITMVVEKPVESMMGFVNLFAGSFSFFLDAKTSEDKPASDQPKRKYDLHVSSEDGKKVFYFSDQSSKTSNNSSTASKE